MKESDFAEATGLLRVLEKRILNSPAIERILDAPSPDEALNLISQNTGYDFSGLRRPEDYEEVLLTALKEIYELLYRLSPAREVVDIAASKYDYHNIKAAIKAKYLNVNADNLFVNVTQIDPYIIQKVVQTAESVDVPVNITTAIAQGEVAFDLQKDPQSIDITLDKVMFSHMLELSQQLNNDYINKYLEYLIDFYNLKSLLRIRNMQKGLRFLNSALIPGGTIDTALFLENYDKSVDNVARYFYYKYFGDMMKKAVEEYDKNSNFSGLEKLTDNFIMEHIKQSKYIAFGPEPLFAYILAKENEIRQIRIILTCKINGIPSDTQRERLRDNYA